MYLLQSNPLPIFLRIKAEVLPLVLNQVLCDHSPCYLSDLISDYFLFSALYSNHGGLLNFLTDMSSKLQPLFFALEYPLSAVFSLVSA